MISKKIEKNTHRSILTLLYRNTSNAGYIDLIHNFSAFMINNNLTYITACYYFIDQYNNIKKH